jgi:3-deoxy-D-manno-octulosonic-acid transferase
MLIFLYNIGIFLYTALLYFASNFNSKARLMISGRENWQKELKKAFRNNTSKVVWFHVASLGEFEQGRPVIELFKKEFPKHKILLTFFSPSGFEVRKNYAYADWVFYLPLDTKSNAEEFLSITKPDLALFVKYEFWYHYINELSKNNIPIISFSCIFRENQHFFKVYGRLGRKTLNKITHFFVQNKESIELLNQIGIDTISLTGDTRFDRVKQICENKKSIPVAAAFKNKQKILILGSSWNIDIDVLAPTLSKRTDDLKIIIAPHEISETNLKHIEKAFSTKKTIRYSKADIQNVIQHDILIIDNIGMLSSLYQYAEFAYIGGGFGAGLHNILEAATFGMPIFIGKNYQKFQEAKDLVEQKGAFCVETSQEFAKQFEFLIENESIGKQAGVISQQYINKNLGASQKIIKYCTNLFEITKDN